MASVNITTSSLLAVASNLRQYAQEMNAIASNMEHKVRSMESWTDQRAQQFTQQTSMVCKGLMLNVDNFVKMADFLQKFAQQQEEIERTMKQKISNV